MRKGFVLLAKSSPILAAIVLQLSLTTNAIALDLSELQPGDASSVLALIGAVTVLVGVSHRSAEAPKVEQDD